MCKDIKKRNTQIVTFHVRGLQTAYWKYNKGERWDVARQLLGILRKQCRIEDLDLRDAHMSPCDVKSFLLSLYPGPDDTLKRLNIVNVISDKSPLQVVHRAGLANYLSLLTRLCELHLNFVWLTPRMLDRVSLECLGLQFLGLEIFSPDFKSIVSAGHWTQVADRLPNLKVRLTLRDSASAADNVEQVRISLHPHLPVDVDIVIV